MSEHFTFRQEVMDKCDNNEEIYELFMESFDALPISADINQDYLCMHGGISKELKKSSDIDTVDRFIEPPLDGFLCDILWSDPCLDKDSRKHKWQPNKERECSVKYGYEAVKSVLKQNNYLSIIRAHQVQPDGYNFHRWGGASAFPVVTTIFSAPNYCGSYKNKGAVIMIENDKMNIKQYKEVPQPFRLPNGLDLFSWSLPFLVDKIGVMMDNLIKRQNVVEVDKLILAKRQSSVDYNKVMKKLEAC